MLVQCDLGVCSSGEEERDLVPFDKGSFVEQLPRFDASLAKIQIFAILQVRLVGVAIVIMAPRWEALVDVAPFDEIFTSL